MILDHIFVEVKKIDVIIAILFQLNNLKRDYLILPPCQQNCASAEIITRV